jgi:hypothetical protein
MEGFLLVCGFVLLLIVLYNRSAQKKDRATDRSLIQDLTTRLYFLEDAVRKLKSSLSEPREQVASEAEAKATPAKPVGPVHPAAAESIPPQEVRTVRVVAPPQLPLKPLPQPPATRPVTPPAPATPPVAHPEARVPTVVAPPRFEAIQAKPARPLREQSKSFFDWVEDKLGAKWAGKIGISLVVVGIAAYLATMIPQLPPVGKVAVGLAAGGGILGLGIWLERNERYRILARAFIGGGWATLFFLSWAVYNLEATRIITSAPLDFVLMLCVAGVMVWHTLRYRSQTVTGLAYLLAFLTVGLNHDRVPFVGGLGAGILLAAGLVIIVGRYQWYELELLGILASYLNHYFWLQPIIGPMNGQHLPFAEFPASASTLLLYWAIFRVSYLWRQPANRDQERISSASALLNPMLLLALLKYQSVHKEWAFWGLLALGAVETALGQLPITRRRRSAVVVLSTLGVVLLVAAFPFRYSGTDLSVLWLVEAEALVLVGVWTREIVFRRLGLLAALLVSGHMVVVDAYRVYEARAASVGSSEYGLAIVFAVAAIVFYGNAHWVSRRWADLFDRRFDAELISRLSYVAALMAFIAAWLAFPETWTAVAWCALAALLAWAGKQFAIDALFYQASVLSAAGIGRALIVNMYETGSYGRFSIRLVTVSLVAALLYLTSHWSWETKQGAGPSPWNRIAYAGYTWTASTLLAVLVWYEFHEQHSAVIAVVWCAGGLLLAWLGRTLGKHDLIYQANAVALAAMARVWFVNFDATETWHTVTIRLLSVGAVAGLLYVSSRWSWADDVASPVP